jgi:hypothetical protein
MIYAIILPGQKISMEIKEKKFAARLFQDI